MDPRILEIDGVSQLKTGFLYLLISVVVAVLGVAAGLLSFFASLSFYPAAGLGSLFGAVAVFVAALVAAAAISLYAVFSKIRGGMRILSQVDGGFKICYTGTTLMIVGLLIVVLGLVVGLAAIAVGWASLQVAGPPFGMLSGLITIFIVALIGGVIYFIGEILTFIIGAFKLNGRYNNSLYMVAGILYIIDIALIIAGIAGILTLVGHILMYIALRDTLDKLRSPAPS